MLFLLWKKDLESRCNFSYPFLAQVLLVRFQEINHPAPLLCLMEAFQDSQPVNSSILLSLPSAAMLQLGEDEAQVACVPQLAV